MPTLDAQLAVITGLDFWRYFANRPMPTVPQVRVFEMPPFGPQKLHARNPLTFEAIAHSHTVYKSPVRFWIPPAFPQCTRSPGRLEIRRTACL
jgi:hypothetical protein